MFAINATTDSKKNGKSKNLRSKIEKNRWFISLTGCLSIKK
jgi:hypothetical protein